MGVGEVSTLWAVRYAETVVKNDIPALDSAVQQRIRQAIEQKLTTDPVHFGKPLRYSMHHLRSLRVWDYGILYHLDKDTWQVSIVAIGHRRAIYEK